MIGLQGPDDDCCAVAVETITPFPWFVGGDDPLDIQAATSIGMIARINAPMKV